MNKTVTFTEEQYATLILALNVASIAYARAHDEQKEKFPSEDSSLLERSQEIYELTEDLKGGKLDF